MEAMAFRIALAGDTMLGRGVGDLLAEKPNRPLCAPEVVDAARSADLFVLNLECCISDRGAPWPDPYKPFFFRAPPSAALTLAALGVDGVTLANNHALDYRHEALLDTLALLDEAGIAWAGAGPDSTVARRPAILERAGVRVALVSLADHPAGFAAGRDRPGIAFAELREGVPAWVTQTIAEAGTDVVLVSPHWGPNMAPDPVPHVRASAAVLAEAGATLVAGHSAHVFQGIDVIGGCPVLYDLGDFIDDYAVDKALRNDLGLLWLVELEGGRTTAIEAVPLALEYGFTRVAEGAGRAWITRRLTEACRPFEVAEVGGRLRIDLMAGRV